MTADHPNDTRTTRIGARPLVTALSSPEHDLIMSPLTNIFAALIYRPE